MRGEEKGSGRGSIRGRASGYPSRLVLVCLALLVLAASPAAATKAPVFDFGSSGIQGGQFNGARGIAINQTGNGGVPANTIYVLDFNNKRVQSFDANGNFIRTWGWDVDTGGGSGFEICEVAPSCQAGIAGGGAGQFNGIAGGIAVDQATGNVYLPDRGNNRVQEFDASGHFIRTWGADVDSTGGSGFEVCEVAANCKAGVTGTGAGMFGFSNTVSILGIGVDSAGNVYVPDADNARVQKFSSSGAFLAMGGWDVDSVNPSSEYEVCTLAPDCKAGVAGSGAGQFLGGTSPSFLTSAPSGDVYVPGRSDGTIYHLTSALAFDPAFAPASVPGSGNSRNALAVNPANGHLFFAKVGDSNIYELDPATQLVVDTHPAEASEWVGLAVNGASGRMYADATTSATFVRVFDDLSGALPKVTIAAATANSGTKATLNASVNPEGVALSECFFEYGKTASYGQSVPCAETPAEIGSGTSPVAVHADLSDLQPNGTKYNFRLVAANTNGLAKSSNESLTTPDTVITQPATGITAAAATLNGTVNPDGVAITECLFEWGTSAAYGEIAPCVPNAAGIGSGTSPVAVKADLSGLQLATVYHFRLKAANANGPILGKDASLQTKGAAIGDSWAQDVTFTEATLKAEIDPEGIATTYRFEYGTQGPCSANPCASAPIPDGNVGSDSAVHEVGALLEGLAQGTTYDWRVVATNADAENAGPDRIFSTYAPLGHDPCANDAFRVGSSATLADCRAYEMVSPVDKNGGDIVVSKGIESSRDSAYREASLDGERVTYTSTAVFAGAVRGTKANQYLAARGPGGWSTEALYPPQGTTVFDPNFSSQYDFNTNFQAFAPDLCHAIVRDQNLAPLTADAIPGYTDLYLRENCGAGAGAYEALTVGGAPTFSQEGVDLELQGRTYSADLEHVVFSALAALSSTPPASGGESSVAPQLYDFHDGALHLVSVLPGGAADPRASFVGSDAGGGALSPARGSNLDRAVSEEGSRIFWSSANSGGLGGNVTIYLRLNAAGDTSEECTTPAKACTIAVSQAGGDDTFWTADTDGTKAIFSEGPDLYEFDVDAALAEEPARTKIAGGAGGVVGASEDLSRLYFTSSEALAPGAVEGEPNLYLRREGAIALVATLAAGDVNVNEYRLDSSTPISHGARVTPDGEGLAFMSRSVELAASVAGVDNHDRDSGEAAAEVYVFDAESEALRCVSCNPSGARPGGRKLARPYSVGTFDFPAAAWLPTFEWTNYAKRALSEDGNRVFFNAFDALVPEDTNGVQDVYEWEAPGTGSCTTSDPRYFPANGGCIHLVSTGRSEESSEFTDASADGSDVFFTTASNIDPTDLGFTDLYDARAGGGFPPPPPPTPPCIGDACQSVPSPPDDQTPTSASFHGPENPKPTHARRCAKGKQRVVRKGKARCARKSKSKKRRANHDRRSAR